MRVTCFPLGPLATNCYLLDNGREALAIDPGGDPAPVLEFLRAHSLMLTAILNTHFHFDHIFGNAALAQATGAKILAPAKDAFLLETEVGGGGFMGLPQVPAFEYEPLEPQETTFLGEPCSIMETPGHTPGSLSLYFKASGRVFVGDLLFARSVGRSDFPGGDHDTLIRAVRAEIFTLPGETIVHAGHGPDTTVRDEQLHNPFFSSFEP